MIMFSEKLSFVSGSISKVDDYLYSFRDEIVFFFDGLEFILLLFGIIDKSDVSFTLTHF